MNLLKRKFLLIWIVGLLSALPIWLPHYSFPATFDKVNAFIFDAYQRLKPRDWAGSDVVVLDIDEASIKRLGQWPWPRTIIADMTDRLSELGAALVVFDVVFSEADRTSPVSSIERFRAAGVEMILPEEQSRLDNDAILAAAFERNYVVAGLVLSKNATDKPPLPKAGHGFSGSEPPGVMAQNVGGVRNLPILDEAADGIGVFSLTPDGKSDGILREIQLLTGANGSFYPTLAMEALRLAQGAGGFKLKSSDGSGEANTGQLRMTSVQVGAIDVPTNATGAMPIYHSAKDAKSVVPVHALMFPDEAGVSAQTLMEEIANHIVFVGTSAEGLGDLRSTPLEPVVPGVFVHAEILDQIVSGSYLVRPDFAKGVELFGGIIAVVAMLLVWPFVNSVVSGLAALCIAFAAVWLSWFQFSNSLYLFSPFVAVASVAIAYVSTSTVSFFVTEKEGRFLRGAFSQYLSPSLVDRLAKNPEKLVLGGEEKELTVLFCDIRGFTSLSEKLPARELTDLLNSFLTPMTSVLLSNGATIDKYMGDAIMAFWNAPIDQENHRELACKSILEMRAALDKLNTDRDLEIKIGIGVNTGSSCVGNLGSDQRFSYSAIGDAVNLTSRIEGLTKQYRLDNLISGDAKTDSDEFVFLEVDQVRVVGRDQPVSIYFLAAHRDSEDAAELLPCQETYNAMLVAYRMADFETAERNLSELKTITPGSLSALLQLYSDRISEFRTKGLPEGWDGIFNASKK
ncbi:MAG: adenylate/guanylate cyclase domain-containing protein [Hyphomicrobiales bacterium]